MNSDSSRLDFVVALHSSHNHIAKISVVNLAKHATARRILVVTARENFDFCAQAFRLPRGVHCSIEVLDENEVVPALSKASVADYLRSVGAVPGRAGWYFQQFLKMGIACRADLGESYVIWDADTVLLRPMTFCDAEGRGFVSPAKESHRPYFATMERLMGLSRIADYSFITEHLVVKTAVMRSLLDEIERRHPMTRGWWLAILQAIDVADLSRSGFSEFETYGNYLLRERPDAIRIRKASSMRRGTYFFGRFPRPADLLLLALRFDFVSFETWQRPNFPRVIVCKIFSLLLFPISLANAARPKLRQ